MNWFKFTGVKRIIASWISAILEIVRGIPGLETVIFPLEVLAGIFGVAGVTNAAVKKTLSQKALATATAFLAALISVGHFFPDTIGPLMPALQKLAAVLGAMAIGANSKLIQKIDKPHLNEKSL